VSTPPPDAPVAIPAVFVREALAGVREQGHDTASLLQAAGIDPDLPLDRDHHVSATQYARLLRRAMAALNDETMGLFSRKLRGGSFALMASAALHGGTLVDALDQFIRSLGLMQDDLVPVLEDDGRHVRVILRFATASVAARPFVHGLLLRLMWRLMSWLDTGKLRAERVELAFPKPEHGDFYLNIFPTELVFGAAHSALWFQSARMQGPVRRDTSALADYLQKAVLDMVIPVIASTRYGDRVRAHLQLEHTRHGQWQDLEQTASALHCSASSLQRHLAKDETSFQSIRDHLRRDWAIYRLQTSVVTTLALAQELGFSDEASFQRAFKRWTGHPPGKLRRRGSP